MDKQTLIKELVKDKELQPHGTDGNGLETHCNIFVWEVASLWKCNELHFLMANEQIDKISKSKNWKEVNEEQAQDYANKGYLVVGGAKADGHGHVVVVIPGTREFSGTFSKHMPQVANVGRENWYGKKASFAFRKDSPPRWWVYKCEA